MKRLALTLALLAATPAEAQTLRIAFKAAVDSADPHLTFTPNRNVQLHVWETLLTQDDTLRPRPLLAESWRAVDPLTWEFSLRPDVRWARVPDAGWPHPDGRPCIDVAAPAEEAAEPTKAAA